MVIAETLGTIGDRLGHQKKNCRCVWRNLGFLLPHGRGALTEQERLLVEEAKNTIVAPEDLTAKEWGIFGAICSCWKLKPWWTEENFDLSRQIVQEMEDRGRERAETYLRFLKENGENNKLGYLTTVFNNVRNDLFKRSGKEILFDHKKAFPKHGEETDRDYAERKDRLVYELTGVLDGERFHAQPCDFSNWVEDKVSFLKIEDLISSLQGEGQAEVLKARAEGKPLTEYAKKISMATGEDFNQVYEREKQHCKRGFDQLRRKVRI